MRRGLSFAALGIATVAGVPQAATACVFLATDEICLNGEVCSGPAFERQRRFAEYQAWRADRARLRRTVTAQAADSTTDFAADLTRALVPLARAQFAQETSCGLEPTEGDPAGYLLGADEMAWASGFSGLPAEQLWNQGNVRRLIPDRAAHHAACNIEYRGRIAELLRDRFPRPVLARLWLSMAEHGFARPRRNLMQFTGAGRTGPLAFGTAPYNRNASVSWNARVAGEYRAVVRMFGRNRDARAVHAAIIAAMAERGSGGSEMGDDSLVCPTSHAAFVADMAQARVAIAAALATPRRRAVSPVMQPSSAQ